MIYVYTEKAYYNVLLGACIIRLFFIITEAINGDVLS